MSNPSNSAWPAMAAWTSTRTTSRAEPPRKLVMNPRGRAAVMVGDVMDASLAELDKIPVTVNILRCVNGCFRISSQQVTGDNLWRVHIKSI